MKIPANVQKEIDAYKAHQGKAESLSEMHRKRAEELAQQIATKEAELARATDQTLIEPTEANIDAETALQLELAHIRAELTAAEDRATRVFQQTAAQATELARKAIKTARKVAQENYDDRYSDKLRAIEDAKYAYLKSLVDLHTLGQEAHALFRHAVQETNPTLAETGRAGAIQAPVTNAPPVFHRNGSPQVWGINEPEITRALLQGLIYRGSVAYDRKIE